MSKMNADGADLVLEVNYGSLFDISRYQRGRERPMLSSKERGGICREELEVTRQKGGGR